MTDYQREYDALMKWATPHVHSWLFDATRAAMVCKCGETRPDLLPRAVVSIVGAVKTRG